VIAAPPASAGMRQPRRAMIRLASGAHTAISAGMGAIVSAARSTGMPRTSCRYSVLKNRKPAIAATAHTAVTAAALNGRLRNMAGSIIGSARCRSQAASTARAAAAAASSPAVRGERHPQSGPWMIAVARAPIRTATSACAAGSGRGGRSARDSGTATEVRHSAASPAGMLAQKIPLHPAALTRTPPATGPSVRDSP